MKDKTDEELLVLLKQGSEEAFTEIFDRHYPVLIRSVHSKLRERDPDKGISKDLVQDVFTKIWNDREKLNLPEGCCLLRFLYTVVKNRILDIYKHSVVISKHTNYIASVGDGTCNDTDYLIRENQLVYYLNETVKNMPENMRVVFELSRNRYMTRSEISKFLDMPEDTVKTNLHRALKRIKKSFFNVID